MSAGWSLLWPHGLPMVTAISCAHVWAHGILKIEGNLWLEGGLPNLSTSTFLPSKCAPLPVRGLPSAPWAPASGRKPAGLSRRHHSPAVRTHTLPRAITRHGGTCESLSFFRSP